MFDSGRLRCAVLVVTAAMLTTGCGRAPESEGDGPKMEFVRIPAGSFQMGSSAIEEDRVHKVRITKPFYMGKYEVTQAQWEAVMGTTVRQQRDKADVPWRLKGEDPEHPMYYVSWEEAVEFCKKLGRKFRLPTEAEWEYACRAGSRTRFHYGDDPNESELSQYAWWWDNSNSETHPVGQKKPNAWGLHDMHGNVREWCLDREKTTIGYSRGGGLVDTTGLASAKDPYRVCRGNSWLDKWGQGSAERGWGKEYFRFDDIGFRVVYTGPTRGDKQVLEIALPERAAGIAASPQQESESRPRIIAGVVRDESGLQIDRADIWILPRGGWVLRNYDEGTFEMSWYPSDPNTPMHGYHFVAYNEQRNLAVGVEIKEDTKVLDVKLKPGVILTGKVVDPNGKCIEGASVAMTELQAPDWSGRYFSWLKTDAEGRFEFKALPPGYNYILSARKIHYLVSRTEVRSESARDNHIDGISIVLPRGNFSVSGVVVDANGKPVPNVWIYCTGKGQAGINSHTDKDGRFKADGIFEGKVDIIASIQGSDGRTLGDSISVEAGATNIRIVLKPGGTPPPKGRACFPAETNVWIDRTVVRISEVARGQTVGEHGCAVPTAAFGQIEDIEEHTGTFECRDIVLDNGNRISVVDAHCFMLDSGKWIAAQDLRIGQRLKTLDGSVTIKSVTSRATPFIGKVYNMKMKDSDRYMVGKDGVIVRDY